MSAPADTLNVGDVFTFRDVPVTVLCEREPYAEPFGRPGFYRYWCQREDTGAEGWCSFGPGALVRLEA